MQAHHREAPTRSHQSGTRAAETHARAAGQRRFAEAGAHGEGRHPGANGAVHAAVTAAAAATAADDDVKLQTIRPVARRRR